MVVGCAGLLLVGAFALLISLAPSFIRWSFQKMEESLSARLPADLTPAERDRLHRAFQTAGHAASSGQGDFDGMRRFQQQMLSLEGSQRQLSHLEVQQLTRALESLSRRPAASPPIPGAPGAPGAPAVPQAPSSGAPPPPAPPAPAHAQGPAGTQTVRFQPQAPHWLRPAAVQYAAAPA